MLGLPADCRRLCSILGDFFTGTAKTSGMIQTVSLGRREEWCHSPRHEAYVVGRARDRWDEWHLAEYERSCI
jgi:hypothetical protein